MLLTFIYHMYYTTLTRKVPVSPPDPAAFFAHPAQRHHRRYEIVRAFFLECLDAEAVASRFQIAPATVYSLTRDFRHLVDPATHFFLPDARPGRPAREIDAALRERILALRDRQLSVPDIKAQLDAEGAVTLTERAIQRVLQEAGRGRLPRRTQAQRAAAAAPAERAPGSVCLDPAQHEAFQGERAAGILCLLPWLRHYRIDNLIDAAGYPRTAELPALQSVLAVLALKLSHVRRYSTDDMWCMDRSLGLFAGLNVLPKTAWFSSYADRTTRAMNRRFLGSLARMAAERGVLGDAANLDFTTLPHWGDDRTLEQHWSTTRGRSLVSLSAALAQDPDSGLLLRADADVRRATADRWVLEFLDFSKQHGPPLRYLAFDSRFTTYAQLARLDQADIRFVTLRRRGKHLVAAADALPATAWREVRVPLARGTRVVTAHDATITLRDCPCELRQITLRKGAHQRPAMLLTNDFEASLSDLVRRYARRWLIEQAISEQLQFFHLNRLSSSMVIKVDFDLAMTVLAFNLYRLFARDLPLGFRRHTAPTLFEMLFATGADIALEAGLCTVTLKKKRNLPALLETLAGIDAGPIPWIGHRRLAFAGATRT